jgi:tetratricopeptide (TPR) repeat protein
VRPFTIFAFSFTLLLFVAWTVPKSSAQDASIDKLLSKLPPPEKLVKPPVQQALQQEDPAAKDGMVREINDAAKAQNLGRALNLSRKLAEKYPRSAGAQCLRGLVAWRLRQFGEASSAFRAATTIQPKFAFAHFGLALVEANGNHFAAAIPHLQRVVELEPKAALAYYALSDCALRVGRKQDSVDYAKKAAALLRPKLACGFNWHERRRRWDIRRRR